jgi:HPt (histidine-containing phosphotransfer) domain-containing protein
MDKKNTANEIKNENFENGSPIDEPELLKRFKADRGFIKELYGVFMEEIPKKIAVIKNALSNNDFKTIEKTAHTLRSSTGTICAKNAFAAATFLEDAAINLNKPLVFLHGDSLIRNLESLTEYIKNRISQSD